MTVSEFGVHDEYLINESTLDPNIRLSHRMLQRANTQSLGLNHKDSSVARDSVHF